MKGRAVMFMGARQPFQIREYDVPDPEPGAIVLKVTQAGVCGSDLHSWRGDGQPAPVPEGGRPTGHEGTGIVFKLGAGVTTDSAGKLLREGDRLMYSAVAPCGQCYQCLNGDGNWCQQGFFPRSTPHQFPYFTGTYADYYYVRPTQPRFRVPDELPDSVLGYVNCAMGTVTEGLMRAGAKEGDYVVVQGAGGLGLNAVAMAKDMGAHRVIVIDRLETRLELARAFGADYTINIDTEWTTAEMRRQRVLELTEGRGADIVLELVGRAELLNEGIGYLANGGTFVEIGNIVRGNTVTVDTSLLLAGKRIIGSAMYRPRLLPIMLENLVKKQGLLPFDKIVSNTFPLEEVNAAFEQAEWQDRQTAVTRTMLVP